MSGKLTPRFKDRPTCPTCNRPMASRGHKAQSGRQRFICTRCRLSATSGPDSVVHGPGYDEDAARVRSLDIADRLKAGTLRRVVITSAQNNTPIDGGFLKALERYCQDQDAELLVVPVHYKNISLYTANQSYKKWWSRRLTNYLVDQRIELPGSVVLRADIKIQATAADPLSGMQPIEGQRWAIFGHPQLRMEPVPSPSDRWPKRMYTTGSVTVRNYSQTKLGAKAEFHHVAAALVVETDGKRTWIRQLNADSKGTFYDLDTRYSRRGVKRNCRVDVLTPGDEHVKFHKKGVRWATYDAPDSMVRVLRPHVLVRHDLLDGYAGSHHHDHDDVLQHKKHWQRENDYRAELDQVVRFLEDTTPKDCENWIISSNHHDHLYKWLQRADPRKDPVNADLILELKRLQYEAARAGRIVDPLQLYLLPRVAVPFRFIDPNRPALRGGVDYSQHGHIGVNGSRGSARALAKTTYKMVIGHSHGARIVLGVVQVGKSTGRLEYEQGLGDHTQTHCVQYPNGKRTLIDIVGQKWRA